VRGELYAEAVKRDHVRQPLPATRIPTEGTSRGEREVIELDMIKPRTAS
jgi:hypothetical protein